MVTVVLSSGSVVGGGWVVGVAMAEVLGGAVEGGWVGSAVVKGSLVVKVVVGGWVGSAVVEVVGDSAAIEV